MAEGEVEINLPPAANQHQRNQLPNCSSSESDHLVFESRLENSKSAIEHQGSERQNEQMFNEIEDQLASVNIFQMREKKGSKSPKKPSRPRRMHLSH